MPRFNWTENLIEVAAEHEGEKVDKSNFPTRKFVFRLGAYKSPGGRWMWWHFAFPRFECGERTAHAFSARLKAQGIRHGISFGLAHYTSDGDCPTVFGGHIDG